jgi:hypothetical protein
MGRTFTVALAFLVALGLAVEPARGGLLTPTDFDTIVLGAQVAPEIVTQFMTADLTGQGGSASHAIGTLTGSVWLEGSVYTYRLVVDPWVDAPSQFSAGYSLEGFAPATDTIGWSYSDAAAAGVMGSPSSAFWLLSYDDGHVAWHAEFLQLITGFWSGTHGTPLTFFLQSSLASGRGRYDFTAAELGSAVNYAPAPPVPAPEPSTLLLLGSATTVVGGLLVRRAHRTKRDGALKG